ncbi:MAG: DUF1446 domain-containing protein [Alphaproteobacteria bacterium]|nr:DUF1446 domain-containing protein [Alphaproteobacteria bacterium]
MAEFRMLSTSGLLGYGFPEESLRAGLARDPDMLGVDGGSTDPGPHYLGSGKTVNSRMSMKRDIRLMLLAATSKKIPLVIGSCGGAGGEPHLQMVADIVREIGREEGLHFKLALIHAEQDKQALKNRLAEGRIRPLRNVADLTPDTIDRAERIVGMMGPEPFMDALDNGAEVVLAGRSSDPAPWAGSAIRAQCPPAPSWYSGKLLECGATAAWPKGHDCLFVSVDDNGITCEATNPERLCTPASVAAQSLHENPHPNLHQEPGGVLDTSACRFEAVSDRAVRVSGMEWRPDDKYTVKLEGAELLGYRAITICGTRDPLLIGQSEDYLDLVREAVATKVAAMGLDPDGYKLMFRAYGRDGVMAAREPNAAAPSHELGILVEVIADSQETPNTVLSVARVSTLHLDFPGRLCNEGNMAFPFSPSDIECGPAYRFSVYHIVEPKDALEMFPIEYEDVRN